MNALLHFAIENPAIASIPFLAIVAALELVYIHLSLE